MTIKRYLVVLVLTGSLIACREQPRAISANTATNVVTHPVSVDPSGSEAIDDLVQQLVSQRPAKYRNGGIVPPMESLEIHRYITPEVAKALKKLQSMPPSVFPQLAKHLDDDRYSYSQIVAGWLNHRVGHAVLIAMCDGHYSHSGYKFRKSPPGNSGNYFSFDGYLRDRGREAWVEWAKSKTRLEIQMNFIDWSIAQENARGYVDDNQKQRILGTYNEARIRMREKYAKPSNVAP